MAKSSLLGFVLIALILFGFMGYQSRQVQKQQAYQHQLDSIAAAEAYAQYQLDSAWRAEHPEAAAAAKAAEEEAARAAAEAEAALNGTTVTPAQ